jgi:uncharacterized SAM-binding protein YcdF (DUF218 family)
MDLFLLKKIVSVLIMPINIVIVLMLVGLFLYRRSPKASLKTFITATFLLVISALPPVSDSLMTSIENDYSPYVKGTLAVDYIVVLGCSHTTNPNLPVTSQLAGCSLQRMVEALRVYELHPEARIITSGFAGVNSVSNAVTVKQSLVSLGVPAQKIITENFPKDTEEEAELIAPRVQGTKIVLVTSASHMPRAINYFQANNIYPIAAPTGFWVKNPGGNKGWRYYLPDSKSLQQTTIAWHEILGSIVQWFKSLFN